MEIMEISKIVADEQKTIQYLQEKGLLQKFEQCPHCGSERIGNVIRHKIKCYCCRKEWGIRKGSLLEGFRIPLGKIVMVIKLFELEITGLQAPKQLKVACDTVMKIYDVLRRAIYYELESKTEHLNGEIEMDGSYFGVNGRGKGDAEHITRYQCLVYWSAMGG